ncbi:hypothetical protein ACPA9J_02280 [Pseudomonas aeruginosa]
MLHDSFRPAPVPTIFNPLNQYWAVMEVKLVAPAEPGDPPPGPGDRQRRPARAAVRVQPLRTEPGTAGGQPPGPFRHHAVLQPGTGRAASARPARPSCRLLEPLHIPVDVQTGLRVANAGAVQDTQNQMPWLDPPGAAGGYIVLGILYERLRAPADHPLDPAFGRVGALPR